MALAAAYKHDAYMMFAWIRLSLDFFDSGLYRPTCTAVARLTLALAKLSCMFSFSLTHGSIKESIIFIIIINVIYRAQTSQGAANAPSQLLHGNSYPRTGTFSVISWTLAVKCPADRVRLEDCSTRLVRKSQNCILYSLSSYVEQWYYVVWWQQFIVIDEIIQVMSKSRLNELTVSNLRSAVKQIHQHWCFT